MRGARVEEIVDALEWIGTRRFPFTARQFAEAFGFHTRTAYRRLAALEAAGAVEVTERPRPFPNTYRALWRVVRLVAPDARSNGGESGRAQTIR
jgi:DNA-binding IclR family transcriptional regulator